MQRAENFMVADIKCSREWRTLSNYVWWISFWGTPEQLHTIISRCWARREIFALIHHTFARQSITWIFYMRIFEPPALGHPSRTCVICSESWTTPGNRSLFLKQNHQIKKRFHANKLPARVKKIHLWNLAIRQGPTAVKLDWNVMGESNSWQVLWFDWFQALIPSQEIHMSVDNSSHPQHHPPISMVLRDDNQYTSTFFTYRLCHFVITIFWCHERDTPTFLAIDSSIIILSSRYIFVVESEIFVCTI